MKLKQLLTLSLATISFASSCGCANKDQVFLDKLNKALSDNATNIKTCYDAIQTVEKKGYEINNHKLSSKQEFVYDSIAKQFVIMNGDSIVRKTGKYQKRNNKFDYFKSVFVYNPNSEYSQYLDKRAEVPSNLLITTGFDIGDHIDIPNIAYVNLSNRKQDVIVRTYSDYFSVLAPQDTVHHYCIATNVIVTDIAKLDEHSSVAYMRAIKGYVNFAKDTSTDIFEVTQGSESEVSIDAETGAGLYSVVNIEAPESSAAVKLESISVSDKDSLKAAITGGDKPFIRLSGDITVDNDCLNFSKPVCLDLNGYKLTLNEGASSSHESISVSNNSAYILDSQGVLDDNSGIVLNNSIISVKNDSAADSTNLVINGGKITQSVKDITGPAILCVGNTSSGDAYNTNVLMYGGKVETHLAEDATVTDTACFTSVGKGANVNIVYGNLISDTYCVSGPENQTGLDFSGASLEINGGHFKSGLLKRGACVRFYEKVTIKINGGNLTGTSCVSACAGTVDIANAHLSATGTYHQDELLSDGSTLDFNPSNDLTVKVSNSTLSSTFAYIVSGKSNGKSLSIDLGEGSYDYFLGEGHNVDKNTKLTIDKSGVWTKHSTPTL